MKCSRLLTAVFIAVCCAHASLGAQPSSSQKQRKAPPPPAPNYDPVPGPFLAVVDEQGALEDVGVVTNALGQWAGPRLAAFSLCFQPAAKPTNWTIALNALDNVSRELKTQGAAVVVVHAPLLCATSPATSVAGKPHVEILGVLRGRD